MLKPTSSENTLRIGISYMYSQKRLGTSLLSVSGIPKST
jgi:hypothetical protein